MSWKWAVLLALPFVVVGLLGRLMVPRWGDAIARHIRGVAALVPTLSPSAAGASGSAGDPGDVVAITVPDLDAGAPDDAGPAPRAGAGGAKGGARVGANGRVKVLVPAAAVQRAIDDGGKHLRGRTVRGPDGKPVGVRLSGVSSAKIGLQDGDVVVAIEGQPTPNDDVATDVALQAIARGASTLHATVMRGDQAIDVTLELPLEPVASGGVVKDAGKAR